MSGTRLFAVLVLIGWSMTPSTGNAAEAKDLDLQGFSERISAHTRMVPGASSDYAYGFVMRRLFIYIRHGKTFDLPEADVSAIEKLSRPNSAPAMRPVFKEISAHLRADDEGSAYELATKLDSAIRAERAYLNSFYRQTVRKLSPKGQAILEQEYRSQLPSISISETDYASLAAEMPDEARVLVKRAASNFRQLYGLEEPSATSSTSSQTYSISTSDGN